MSTHINSTARRAEAVLLAIRSCDHPVTDRQIAKMLGFADINFVLAVAAVWSLVGLCYLGLQRFCHCFASEPYRPTTREIVCCGPAVWLISLRGDAWSHDREDAE